MDLWPERGSASSASDSTFTITKFRAAKNFDIDHKMALPRSSNVSQARNEILASAGVQGKTSKLPNGINSQSSKKNPFELTTKIHSHKSFKKFFKSTEKQLKIELNYPVKSSKIAEK